MCGAVTRRRSVAERAGKLERLVNLVFVALAAAWLAVAVVIVGWEVLHMHIFELLSGGR